MAIFDLGLERFLVKEGRQPSKKSLSRFGQRRLFGQKIKQQKLGISRPKLQFFKEN